MPGLLDKILKLVLQEYFDLRPGFIIENMQGHKIRNCFYSESALVELEKKLDAGKLEKIAYGSGKEFGHSYARKAYLPNYKSPLAKLALDVLFKNFESVIATRTTADNETKLSYEADFKEKTITLSLRNVIVCRKTGVSNWLDGALAGLFAFFFEDDSIETTHVKCQGRGDAACEYVFAPSSKVKPKISCANFEKNIVPNEYLIYNTPFEVQADYGLETLSKYGFTKYSESSFEIKGERFIPLEASFSHVLEKNLVKQGKNTDKLVSEPVRKAFAEFSKNATGGRLSKSDSIDYACKWLSALGWGFVGQYPGRQSVFVQGFPWTPELETAKKSAYFQGALEGILLGAGGVSFETSVSKKSVQNSRLDLVIDLKT